jgi:hypothetical protein
VSFMLSVANKLIMPSVVMPRVVMPSVIMTSAVMLNVVMLSVVAPFTILVIFFSLSLSLG